LELWTQLLSNKNLNKRDFRKGLNNPHLINIEKKWYAICLQLHNDLLGCAMPTYFRAIIISFIGIKFNYPITWNSF